MPCSVPCRRDRAGRHLRRERSVSPAHVCESRLGGVLFQRSIARRLPVTTVCERYLNRCAAVGECDVEHLRSGLKRHIHAVPACPLVFVVTPGWVTVTLLSVPTDSAGRPRGRRSSRRSRRRPGCSPRDGRRTARAWRPAQDAASATIGIASDTSASAITMRRIMRRFSPKRWLESSPCRNAKRRSSS